jgi:uncharacterized protein (TIGR00255 family)
MVQIKSMTGFGTVEVETKNITVKTEIKSLNNKFLELNVRLPRAFKDRDIELRQLLSLKIGRGSVSVNINIEKKQSNNGGDTLTINEALALSYSEKLKGLANTLKIDNVNLFNTILTMPDVVKYEETDGDDTDWQIIKESVEKAFLKFDEFRIQEGNVVAQYLKDCVAQIDNQLLQVKKEEGPRKDSVKGKLLQALKDNKEEASIDQNRFEQEIIYYLEKYDIAEEKSRLANHINYFNETLENDANGKKLSFISQEMGREINTMGSKAYYFPIQQAVVCMKEELEKIKEQLLNIL